MAHAASRRPRKRCRTRLAGVLLVLGLAGTLPAHAQLQLPGRLPTVPGVPNLTRRAQEVRPVDTLTSAIPLQDLRRVTVRNLLQQQRDTLEADPAGEPVVRGELLLASPTEIVLATRLGAPAVKLFPAARLGSAYVRDLRGPLPDLRLIATGGVFAGNAAEFLEAGCIAVAAGGALATGDPDAARALVDVTSLP